MLENDRTEDAVTTYDIKKERRDLYAPGSGFGLVDVPTLTYLMADGAGDPNTAPAYRAAVEALFTMSYAVRALAKERLGRVHTVGPLEGLWTAPDLDAFRTRDKSAWTWTMMVVQPDWVTGDLVADAAASVARKKRLDVTGLVRLEEFTKGLSVQFLHVGSYDDEAPAIARMHTEFLPANGLVPRGRHHEVYLSDPQRVEAAKLRTIIRQPVAPA